MGASFLAFSAKDGFTGRFRWFWSAIEPEQGHYRWEILHSALEEARRHGQTLDIRLMPYDQKHPLPEWFRNSGARRANKPEDKDGKIWQPDFSDPLYLKFWGELVVAAGAHYDGSVYVSDTLKPGAYHLRVALLDPRTGDPAIKLAIEGRQPDGWYDMGEIQVE